MHGNYPKPTEIHGLLFSGSDSAYCNSDPVNKITVDLLMIYIINLILIFGNILIQTSITLSPSQENWRQTERICEIIIRSLFCCLGLVPKSKNPFLGLVPETKNVYMGLVPERKMTLWD